MSAQLRLERFSAGATLTTTPTTNSPAIAALLILDPSAVAKLWNYADVTVVLDTVTAEVVIYTEQDRFGLEPPTFKVLVAGAQAGPQSFLDATIAHFSLGPSTLLTALHSELDTEFIQRILDAVEELAEKSLTGALESLADKLTLQPLLTLDQEPFREAAGARIRVDLDVHGNPELGGYNPVALSMPLLDRNGTPLTMAEIDSMQRSFLALSAARMRFECAAEELSAAEMALSKFRSERPPGITVVSGQSEPGGFTLGLSICEPTVPGSGSALTYSVVPMTPLGADVCLVLSGATVIDVFHSIRTGIAYSGPPRNIDRIVESLVDAPELDWWRDAAEPDQLGPRIQLSRNARSTFRFLPLLTCRFDIGEGSAIGGLEIEAGGPLAGLETRANRLWLEQLMVAHAFTLLTAPAARYRRTSENGLSYAYGATFGTRLTPENFTPRLLLALHPTHWSTGDRLVDDPAVPFLTLETFGANPDLLNLAVKLTLDENVLGSI